MATRDGTFTIVQISDLHCGTQFFLPELLERAITEVNDIEPDIVICSGDLTTFGLQGGVRAREGLPRPDRVRLPRRDPRATTTRATSATSTSRSCSAIRNSVARVGGVTVVAVDSTGARPRPWPDRTRALPLDRGKLRCAGGPAHLRLPPPPAAGARHGRERNVIYDAGDTIECLQRSGVNLVLSGHKHVPYAWRLEDLFIVNAGTVSSLRLRGNTRPCYNVIEFSGTHVDVWRRYPFHGQEKIISSRPTRSSSRSTRRGSRGR
jgi:3',5'-cyclic AMP phosphodiesterase CpdA